MTWILEKKSIASFSVNLMLTLVQSSTPLKTWTIPASLVLSPTDQDPFSMTVGQPFG